MPPPRSRRAAAARVAGSLLLLGAAVDAARLAYADAALRAGSPDAALAAAPSFPAALAAKARALAERVPPKDAEALAFVDRAVAAAPRRSTLRCLRASILAALGRGEEAHDEVERAFALDPRRAPVARRAAEAILDRAANGGDPDSLGCAAARFRLANEAEPSRVEEAMFALRAAGADLAILEASVPSTPPARLAAGRAFLDLGAPGAAAAWLDSASGGAKDGKRLALLGRARLLLGDRDAAAIAYRSAVAAAGADAVRGIPRDGRDADDREGALAILDRLAEDPGVRLAAVLGAVLCLELGDPGGAARRIASRPDLAADGEALAVLASAHRARGFDDLAARVEAQARRVASAGGTP